jgi:hypothetical protein
MSYKVSTNRDLNKYDYSQDIRPYILTSSNSNIIADNNNFGGSGGISNSNILNDDGKLIISIAEIEQLVCTNINTYELTTTYMNSFTVKNDKDVKFLGSIESNDKLLWDSSEGTLYIDGDLKTEDPFIYLNNQSSNNGIPQSEYNTDIGVLMKYWNTNYLGTKMAFFGRDGANNRLRYLTGVSRSTINDKLLNLNDTGDNIYGDMELNTLYISKIAEHDDGNSLDIISNNDLNIISGGDLNFYGYNVNYNISGGYSLTNNLSNINFTSISSDLNLSVTDGDTNIDTFNGNLDIQVAGNNLNQIIIQNSLGDINIISGSNNTDSIHIDTDGGILMNTEELNIVTSSSNELSFNDTDGLSSNIEKSDFQKWISFKDFDVISGYWFTTRSLINTLPIHYWKKERNEENSIIYVDVDLSSRSTNLKGYKLKKIFFGYKIENVDIFNLNTIITKKTFDPTNTNPLTVTQVNYNDINLNQGITANTDHYRGIEIGSPFFIQNNNILNIELSISSTSTSDFLFYGCNLEFSRNDL